VFSAGSADNYTISYVNGSLTENTAVLTFIADDTGTASHAGQAVVSTAGIIGGVHPIVAVYRRNVSDGGSQSPPFAWRVNLPATAILRSSSPVSKVMHR
jgi:hypothetical protein